MKKLLLVLFLVPNLCSAKLFWVSDLHLGSEKPKVTTETIYPRKSYNWFLSFLKKNVSSSDYVVVTGDITNRGKKKYYKKLKKLQRKYKIIYVKGNHDKNFHKYFPLNRVVDTPDYRIITLYSGGSSVYGSFDESQLDFLRNNFTENTIVAMHHPCYAKDFQFLDFCNPILDLQPQMVLTGHYHFSVEKELDGIQFLTIPAFSADKSFQSL